MFRCKETIRRYERTWIGTRRTATSVTGTIAGLRAEWKLLLRNRSDVDARTYKHLCDLNIYGDVELQKEECINHVGKRLGTALRKLASSGKKNGMTLGGRGHGKLKQATILKLTAYYGKAVRANSNNLDAMRDPVLATFHHATWADETPQHDLCLVVSES